MTRDGQVVVFAPQGKRPQYFVIVLVQEDTTRCTSDDNDFRSFYTQSSPNSLTILNLKLEMWLEQDTKHTTMSFSCYRMSSV